MYNRSNKKRQLNKGVPPVPEHFPTCPVHAGSLKKLENNLIDLRCIGNTCNAKPTEKPQKSSQRRIFIDFISLLLICLLKF